MQCKKLQIEQRVSWVTFLGNAAWLSQFAQEQFKLVQHIKFDLKVKFILIKSMFIFSTFLLIWKMRSTTGIQMKYTQNFWFKKIFFFHFQQQQSRFSGSKAPIPRPSVQQMYNLFHPSDPIGCRIEPLLSAPFSRVPPVNVSRYQKYPMGDGACYSLIEFIQSNCGLFADYSSIGPSGGATCLGELKYYCCTKNKNKNWNKIKYDKYSLSTHTKRICKKSDIG